MKKNAFFPILLLTLLTATACGRGKHNNETSSSRSVLDPNVSISDYYGDSSDSSRNETLTPREKTKIVLASEFGESVQETSSLKSYSYTVRCNDAYAVTLKAITTTIKSNLRIESNLSFTLGEFLSCEIACKADNPNNDSLSYDFKYTAKKNASDAIEKEDNTESITSEGFENNQAAKSALSTYVSESVSCINKCIGYIHEVLRQAKYNIQYSILSGD